jgi:hypothetical protein
MSFGLQDVLATGAAIAALAVIVQKVLGTIRPSHPPACANCPLFTLFTNSLRAQGLDRRDTHAAARRDE